MYRILSASTLAAMTALAGCAVDTAPEAKETESAATLTATWKYAITIARIQPSAVPDVAPNEYHLYLGAATSSQRQLFTVDDVYAADAVQWATYEANDTPRLGRFTLGQIPVTDGDTLRIAILGDDNSGNTTLHWADDGERAPPAFATAHNNYLQQANGFVSSVGQTPMPFRVDATISMLAGGDERTCSGPFLADAWEFSAADLLAKTSNGTFTYQETRQQTWSGVFDSGDDDHGCPARPSTSYTIRIERLPPSFGAVPTCHAIDLVPQDSNDVADWYGTWADQPTVESSRIYADVYANPTHFGMIVSSSERIVTLGLQTTWVNSSLVGAIPYFQGVTGYVGDHWPPSFLIRWPPPPPPPVGAFGSHDIASSTNGVRLEKHVGRCAENGLPIQRMRYMRFSGSTMITDIMLQPAQHVPK